MAGYSSYTFEQVMANATADQVVFSQLYFSGNTSSNIADIQASEAAGAKAIVWSVDSPGSPDRQRAARYDVSSGNDAFVKNTWALYDVYRNATSLPIILKGIQNVEDARAAVDHGVPAIVLSNHGGRNLDGSPSSLEVALEIYQQDPDIFSQIDVLADGGVRYGTDALKLLALGVKAVSGLSLPYIYICLPRVGIHPSKSNPSSLTTTNFCCSRSVLDAPSCSPTCLAWTVSPG